MRQVVTKAVVAVSGGIDSVVLLDILTRQTKDLIVAHVDHGIRADSGEDEALVRELAERYELPYETTKLDLGPGASEEVARDARYSWLESVRERYDAATIATAHHRDDVYETMIMNMMRGTGWRGLSSLRETPARYRPLLSWTKLQIVDYATSQRLAWREDSTNDDMKYARNRIRHGVMPYVSQAKRTRLSELYESQLALRGEIEAEVQRLVGSYVTSEGLDRHALIMVPDDVAYELLRAWLGESLETMRYRDLLVFIKTGKNGAKWSLDKSRFVMIKNQRLIV